MEKKTVPWIMVLLLLSTSVAFAAADTVGVYRPADAAFYLCKANGSGWADMMCYFGAGADQPPAGDWDGNGTVTIGVYRPSDGLFHLHNSNDMGFGDMVFAYGIAGDLPVAGVWEKQTLADPVIVRFSAEPQTIAPGAVATLSWSNSNATSAAIDQGIGAVNAVGGSLQVSPNVTTTYLKMHKMFSWGIPANGHELGVTTNHEGLPDVCLDRGRDGSSPPLPPNRAGGFPAHGSPVGSFTSARIELKIYEPLQG